MPELQLDGLVGPSHNHAGLSLGNLASAANAGAESTPRAAALQGLAKMRLVAALSVPQGWLLPHARPNFAWLRTCGFTGTDADVVRAAGRDDPALLAAACSASAMWTANAATVTAAADSGDGRVHLSVANLSTMAHRALGWPGTLAQLRVAFADGRWFAVHGPVPFADEGAANHMRLSAGHEAEGVDVFVHGPAGTTLPARQHPRAFAAVARRHGVQRAAHVAQSVRAIDAGAFHNDVVAVANGPVLFAHEHAFADREALLARLAAVPGFVAVEALEADVPLAAAVSTYLFNSQLLSLPDGSMALVLPGEVRANPRVWSFVERVVAANSPIAAAHVVDVRASMANGGGPACLRLRVPLGDAAMVAVDPRFLASSRALDAAEAVVERWWPERIAPADLGEPELWDDCAAARAELLAALGFAPGELDAADAPGQPALAGVGRAC